MLKTTLNKAAGIFNVDFSDDQTIGLEQQKTLRLEIGLMGILLPIVLPLVLFLSTGYKKPLESISHYYYSRVGSIFVTTVFLWGIFLMIYKGKEPIDFILSTIAGFFALCVVFFPTDNLVQFCYNNSPTRELTYLEDNSVRETFHFISAGIFLVSLAIMSICIFTKSKPFPEKKTKMKIIRNRFYRIFGAGIILALSIIAFGHLTNESEPEFSKFYDQHHLTFWMETVAVECFGWAWLIKGEAILKD